MIPYTILEGVLFQKVSQEVKFLLKKIKSKEYKYSRTKNYNPIFEIEGISFRPWRALGENPYVLAFIEKNQNLSLNRKEEILIAEALLKEENKKVNERENERLEKTRKFLKSIFKK
jgi:hypothetical protein